MNVSPVAAVFCILALRVLAAQPTPEQLLSDAQARATSEGKAVFVYFGVRCAWLQDPQIGPRFEKYFVPVKLVLETSETGPDDTAAGMKKRLGGEVRQPFVALLDNQGKLIVNSSRAGRKPEALKVEFPSEPEEVEWMMSMLKKAAPKLTGDDSKAIKEALILPLLQRTIDQAIPPRVFHDL
jgi:hypothetical protein